MRSRGAGVAPGWSFDNLVKQYWSGGIYCRDAAILISACFPTEITLRRNSAILKGEWETAAVIDEVMLAFKPVKKWKSTSTLEESLGAIREHFGKKNK